MSSEKNLGALPTDFILQIFSRLPAKSIARCRCVSKLWASLLTIGSPYFTELFLTQSVTRPRLLFAVLREQNDDQWCLYSSPQPQISSTNSTSSISVTAEFHMPLPKSSWLVHISPPVSGLIFFSNIPDLKIPTLCNPSTGHIFSLPQLTKTVQSYFGYDPINKQFSILAISFVGLPSDFQILKFGSGRLSWRSLKCPLHHYPSETNICINGILYYTARLVSNSLHKIACFDLNSEEFQFIDQPWYGEHDCLVNFKGKLGVIKVNWAGFSVERVHFKMSLWVLKDADKEEWSEHVYILPLELWNEDGVSYYFLGMTATGDIVLTLPYTKTPFCVYFFNLEKKTLHEVEIKGFGELSGHNSVLGWVDYVEELKALNWS